MADICVAFVVYNSDLAKIGQELQLNISERKINMVGLQRCSGNSLLVTSGCTNQCARRVHRRPMVLFLFYGDKEHPPRERPGTIARQAIAHTGT